MLLLAYTSRSCIEILKDIWELLLECNRIYPGFLFLVIFCTIAFIVLAILVLIGINRVGKEASFPGTIHLPWGDF